VPNQYPLSVPTATFPTVASGALLNGAGVSRRVPRHDENIGAAAGKYFLRDASQDEIAQ
jgi:hypothetical protein